MHFSQLFHRLQNQREILRFISIHKFFSQKFFFGVILALFENFEAKRTKNCSKNQKNIFRKCVLDFNFAPIKGLYSSFSKKKSHSLYSTVHLECRICVAVCKLKYMLFNEIWKLKMCCPVPPFTLESRKNNFFRLRLIKKRRPTALSRTNWKISKFFQEPASPKDKTHRRQRRISTS